MGACQVGGMRFVVLWLAAETMGVGMMPQAVYMPSIIIKQALKAPGSKWNTLLTCHSIRMALAQPLCCI